MGWSPSLAPGRGSLYLAIADALEADVAAGRLAPGEKLPTQRELARRLGIDLTTVTRAFAEAAGRGLIHAEGRRGSFVRGTGGSASADLSGLDTASGMNMPPEPEDRLVRDRMLSGLAALLAERIAPLHYQPPGGAEPFRASAAAFVSRILPGTGADQMVITAGSQHALQAIGALLLAPGARIAAGAFAYPGLLSVARRCGAELVGLAMDEEGVIPEAVEREVRKARLAALYLVPTNDNPTTATMGARRRRRIAALARQHGFALIEDDAYGRLREEPLPAVTSFAPELGWHITTLAKLVSPALRVAYVRTPSVRDAFGLAAAAHESAVMAPPLNVALAARWMDDGGLQRLIAAVRAESSARVADAAAVFGAAARWQPEGYHLWLPLPERVNASQLAAQAIAAGLPAVPSATFAVDPANPFQALRISLGGSATRPNIAREVRRLEAMLGGISALV